MSIKEIALEIYIAHLKAGNPQSMYECLKEAEAVKDVLNNYYEKNSQHVVGTTYNND